MQTYLALDVPLRKESRWFNALKTALRDYPVSWQNGFYHITMVFIDENPKHIDLKPIFRKHLSTAVAPVLEFNKIDVFTANNGKEHIINLTSTIVPDSFISLIESIRYDLKQVGCILESDFKLHVTLGRLDTSTFDLTTLTSIVDQVKITPFSLVLTDAHFKVRGSKKNPIDSIILKTKK